MLGPSDQQFSAEEDLPPGPPQGYSAMSGDNFDHYTWVRGGYDWHLVGGGQICCSKPYSVADGHTRDHADPEVISTQMDKLL